MIITDLIFDIPFCLSVYQTKVTKIEKKGAYDVFFMTISQVVKLGKCTYLSGHFIRYTYLVTITIIISI